MSFCDSCCRWFPFSLSCCVSLFLPCLPLPSVFPCSSPVFLILPLSPNKLHPLIFLCVVLYVCFHLLHSHHERRFGIEGRVGRHPNVSVSDESLSNGLRLTEVGSHHHFNSLQFGTQLFSFTPFVGTFYNMLKIGVLLQLKTLVGNCLLLLFCVIAGRLPNIKRLSLLMYLTHGRRKRRNEMEAESLQPPCFLTLLLLYEPKMSFWEFVARTNRTDSIVKSESLLIILI